VANCRNVVYGQHLDLPASTMPSITAKQTGAAVDEMAMSFLTRKWTMIGRGNFPEDASVGNALYIADLCPCAEWFYQAQGSNFSPCLLSFVSQPFQYWRGGLEFRIEFAASMGHTARLQICSHYGLEGADLTLDVALGQYTAIFNVCGNSSINIRFPWRAVSEWLLVPHGSVTEPSKYSMGQWSLRVLTGLQRPETCADNVDFRVMMRGAPDFKVAHIGNGLVDLVCKPWTAVRSDLIIHNAYRNRRPKQFVDAEKRLVLEEEKVPPGKNGKKK